MDGILSPTGPGAMSLQGLIVNLVLSLVVSSAVGWFYVRFGRSLANRPRFAQILPLLSVTTALVISIIKSSVALSLGLVGALSIVRFRTAIKDPEELLYLFVAIAVGLGMGADEQLPTILAVLVILGYVVVRDRISHRQPPGNLFLDVTTSDPDATIGRIRALLARHAADATLRRVDRREQVLQVTYLMASPSEETVAGLLADIQAELPASEVTIVEQDNLLGG